MHYHNYNIFGGNIFGYTTVSDQHQMFKSYKYNYNTMGDNLLCKHCARSVIMDGDCLVPCSLPDSGIWS